ncbi:hypothetical protein [Cecembia rubra]|uniref:hypothetical protein n=1 Tax=Cecembia rubra TaxID=1485585 RepID=UPI0027148095|nr:hypothetical protein [Cecembia rubra]
MSKQVFRIVNTLIFTVFFHMARMPVQLFWKWTKMQAETTTIAMELEIVNPRFSWTLGIES